MATLTLNALYDYDPSIFDGFRVPALLDLDDSIARRTNAPVLSKKTAIEKIIFDTLGLSLVYPSADDLRQAITTWTETNFSVWVGLYQTMVLRYNPIWNKDGVITETHNGSYSNHSDGTGTHNVTGYDSAQFSPDTQDIGNNNGNGSDEYTNTRTETGNIGITSTQELIERERNIAGFSLYQYIADSFKYTFCVCCY